MGGIQKAENTDGIETSRFNANQEAKDEIQRLGGQNRTNKDERENDQYLADLKREQTEY
jgi:hypothetical protein